MLTLVIMDGFGQRRTALGNAIKAASTPNLDYLKKHYPHTLLKACEGAVGLPKGQEGNSEAGHINMGAGRVVKQDVVRIDEDISNGTFANNKAFIKAINHVKKNNSNLHIFGLCSNGGLHSKITHIKELLKLCKKYDLKRTYLHLFTDGRDTPVDSGVKFVQNLENFAKKLGVGKIASLSGRVYAMDREKRYERLKKSYDAIVLGQAPNFKNAKSYLLSSYEKGVYDEFIEPVIIDGGKAIQDGDSIIFANYRTDRARELTDAITQQDFEGFDTKQFKNLFYVCMTEYDKTFKDVEIAYHPEPKLPPVGKVIADAGLKQFRVSETTKYAHVTFFFNGGQEEPYKNEDRCLIETKNLKSFASFPQMRAGEIADSVVGAVESGKYDFVLANLSNCDMVGHTGDFEATVKAVESVDKAVGKIVDACKKCGGTLIVTADHGNADNMIDKDGAVVTSHSMSKVPFILISDKNIELRDDGIISDIAPTVLEILNIKKPKHFTSNSLIK